VDGRKIKAVILIQRERGRGFTTTTEVYASEEIIAITIVQGLFSYGS
jgi:hypothetical protein